MPLTDAACRNAKATDKACKLTDEAGLYLLVKPAGKYWRFDYRHAGKRKTLALGVYPRVTLQQAHKQLEAARLLLEDGTDPAPCTWIFMPSYLGFPGQDWIFRRIDSTSHPFVRRCARNAGSNCRSLAAAALPFTSRHQLLPSMGPACTAGRSMGGIKPSMALSRALESRVSAVSRARVGDSWLACCSGMA